MTRWFFKTKQERKAESARKLQEQQERRQNAELSKQSDYYADLISRGLAQMGIVHDLPVRRRPTLLQRWILRAFGVKHAGRQMMEFISARYEPNAIYLEIDTLKIPYPHNLDDISSEAVLRTLSSGCRRRVSFVNMDPENGTWYVIYLNGATAGLPIKFKFSEAILNTPKEIPPLWYIAGVTQNRKLIHDDLSKMPNWLIAGSTRSGKTVHLRSFLLQILHRNSPDTVQLILIDLKGGMEFKVFRRLPHLWRGKPIVSESTKVISALRQYFTELKRRQHELAKTGLYDIQGWNHLHPEDKWPYVILVFDEVAQALKDTNRKFAREVEHMLGNIMAVSAATGGHTILCTQRPSSDVVTGFLKTNLSGRTCFAVPDQASSKVILDSTEASLIDGEREKGRAIHLRGSRKILIQTPKVTKRILEKGVRVIIHKWTRSTATEVTAIGIDELLHYALKNFNGALSRRLLLTALKRRGLSRPRLEEMIASLNGSPVVIDGQTYHVVDKGPPKGRYLVPVETINLSQN